jgi:hypothetical protein
MKVPELTDSYLVVGFDHQELFVSFLGGVMFFLTHMNITEL